MLAMRATTPTILLTACFLVGCGGEVDPLRDDRARLDAIEPSDAAILALARDDRTPALARGLFSAHCAVCHSVKGTGINGPNLTDDAYLNVESPSDFFDVISYGRHAKGMPAWEDTLGRAERVLLAAYAASLRGASDGGRAPEGDVLPPWDAFLE